MAKLFTVVLGSEKRNHVELTDAQAEKLRKSGCTVTAETTSLDSLIAGVTNKPTNGKGSRKSEAEKKAEAEAKAEAWKAEKKAYADQFSDEEKEVYKKAKAYGRVLRDAYTKASADMVGTTLKGTDRKAAWSTKYEQYIAQLSIDRKLDESYAVAYKLQKEIDSKK